MHPMVQDKSSSPHT